MPFPDLQTSELSTAPLEALAGPLACALGMWEVGLWGPWISPLLEVAPGMHWKGPRRWPQKRLGRRLEEVAEAVGGGYCRLQMPLRLALAVRESCRRRRCIPAPFIAGHSTRSLGGGGRLQSAARSGVSHARNGISWNAHVQGPTPSGADLRRRSGPPPPPRAMPTATRPVAGRRLGGLEGGGVPPSDASLGGPHGTGERGAVFLQTLYRTLCRRLTVTHCLVHPTPPPSRSHFGGIPRHRTTGAV